MSAAAEKVLWAELCQADAQMTRRERALSDALTKLIREVSDAGEFLGLLTNPAAEGYDPAVAMVVDEARLLIADAAISAAGLHAAVVADILGPGVH